MRIAIVGAGVSGLVVAHLLHREHEITVFEAGDYAGGHTNTIRVDTPNETHHVDTGFIVFNDRNYPNFERLLQRLGVPWQPSTMTFSVSDGIGDFEYSGSSANGLFAKRAHLVTPSFHRMVADLARFNRSASELLRAPGEGPSLGQWLEEQRFSRPFVERLIVPQAAAVWSADPRQMWSFPARFLVEFFDNHGMLGFTGRPRWQAVRGGSARYVEALTAPWRERLAAARARRAIERTADGVLVRPRGGEARALRRGRARDPFRPGARDADRRKRGRARDPRGDPVSAQRGGASHRRADAPAATARMGELELSPARGAEWTRDGDLPHEPSAVSPRRARVLCDAEQDFGDRPG